MHVPVHDGWYLFSSSGSGARHSHGLRSIGRPDLATLVLAVIRGLLMDLDATGDTTRTDRAFRDFLGAVEHLSSGYRSTAYRSQECAGSSTTSTDTASGT
jgi:hypothetical protein